MLNLYYKTNLKTILILMLTLQTVTPHACSNENELCFGFFKTPLQLCAWSY